LTGGVAHDFNNILTVIIGYSELALRQITEQSAVHGELVEIRKAAERAATLTRQLLAFSRRQVLQPRVINLANVLMDMDRMLRRLLGEHIEMSMRSERAVRNVRRRSWADRAGAPESGRQRARRHARRRTADDRGG